jgi:hypothetical protein
LSRIVGKQTPEPEKQTVLVRDHSVDLSGQEMDAEEVSQLEQLPPFSINKVNQINIFN